MTGPSHDHEPLGPLLDCIEQTAGGLNERIQARRACLVAYWYGSKRHEFRDPPVAVNELWCRQICDLVIRFTRCYERLLEELSRGESPGEEALGVLHDVRRTLEAVLTVGPAAQPSSNDGHDEVMRGVHRALGAFYRWDDNHKLRAYLYCWTGEVIAMSNLASEKSRVLNQVEECLERFL